MSTSSILLFCLCFTVSLILIITYEVWIYRRTFQKKEPSLKDELIKLIRELREYIKSHGKS